MIAYCMFLTQGFATGYNHVVSDAYQNHLAQENLKLIKNVFDQYRFRMTVEWDQKDQAFAAQAQAEFKNALLSLTEKGISLQEVQTYMMKTMLSDSSKQEYLSLVNTLKAQGKTDQEIAQVAGNFMSKNYQTGASYSAGASGSWKWAAIVVAVVAVAVVTVLVVKKVRNNDEPEQPEEEQPEEEPGCECGEGQIFIPGVGCFNLPSFPTFPGPQFPGFPGF